MKEIGLILFFISIMGIWYFGLKWSSVPQSDKNDRAYRRKMIAAIIFAIIALISSSL